MLQIDLMSLSLATVRSALGILFFFQAYDKIFNVGFDTFLAGVVEGEEAKRLPRNFLKLSIRISSYIELVGGLLLLTGLFLPFSYTILSINLLMVILAFSFFRPIWDMSHVFPRLAMLVFLMAMPLSRDIYHLAEWTGITYYFF